jgi:hypothetical protein
MTSRKIKIIKRDAPIEVLPEETLPPPATDLGLTNTVKNWISERRENSDAERGHAKTGSKFGRSVYRSK